MEVEVEHGSGSGTWKWKWNIAVEVESITRIDNIHTVCSGDKNTK